MSVQIKMLANESIEEIAARFFLLDEAGKLSADDQQRLTAWLDADPKHRAAYEDTFAACALVTEGAADPEIMAMRKDALAARGERRTDWPRTMAAIASAILVAGAFGWMALKTTPPAPPHDIAAIQPSPIQTPDPNTATYTTLIGERLVVALPDGSAATLDTNSTLQVAYTPTERGIHLLKGQALFDVAKHKPISFQVYAGTRRITAVGTKFNVRLENGDVKVALLEGVVKIAPTPRPTDTNPQPSIIMRAGEVADAPQAAAIRITPADTDKIASWRSGVLVFTDKPLAEAIAEMNRYSLHPIRLSDREANAFRISGVFKTGDPEHFAETMANVFPLSVTVGPDGATVLTTKK
jgi:transmembrane sensor